MQRYSRFFLIAALAGYTLASCSVFKKNKEGCPSDGRNVGAEKMMENLDSKKKQPKWRGGS